MPTPEASIASEDGPRRVPRQEGRRRADVPERDSARPGLSGGRQASARMGKSASWSLCAAHEARQVEGGEVVPEVHPVAVRCRRGRWEVRAGHKAAPGTHARVHKLDEVLRRWLLVQHL